MKLYYPASYYSYKTESTVRLGVFTYFKNVLHAWSELIFKNPMGFVLSKFNYPPGFFSWFEKINPSFKLKILDVGCGNGELLSEFRKYGFKNLTGIDPFIENDIHLDNGVIIYKKEIEELDSVFDFIIFNHSFEHMSLPLEVLKKTYSILNPGGFVLIRVPVTGEAWEKYHENWVQIDAPRHFYIHSIKSMKILTEKAGFKLNDIVFDSTEFQFWGSEQYKKGIPLISEQSYAVNPGKSLFTPDEISSYLSEAKELNRKNEGDQACFYLMKPK